MANQDDPRYRYQTNRESMETCDDVEEEDKEAIAEFLDAIDPNQLTTTFTNEDGETETKSTNTLRTYCYGLKRVAEVSETPLVELDAVGVNELMGALREGRVDHDNVKDDGYSKSYLKPWQAALRGFYRYHDDLGVTSNELVIFTQDSSSVDERDMYTRDEVEALRNAVDNARDKCLLELFLNTGQRIRAIQTLRIKDVDPSDGVTGAYYLNTDMEGLKGAEENGAKRPLLGAKRPVKDWLDFHPTGEPDDYLITGEKDHHRVVPGEQLSQSTIRYTLRKIADEADVDKPPNPHNFRHYFVTMCKRHYGMDDATIKHLIGHGEGSQVMETTYSHLTDEDHIKDAEIDFGVRDEEDESPFTPPVCMTCGDNLAPDDKACGGCGTVYTPDAHTAQEQIDKNMRQGNREAAPDDEEAHDELDALEQIVSDPETLAKALNSPEVQKALQKELGGE